MRPDFPLVWDNTMRSDLVKCPRKWAWAHLHHWSPKSTSIHLHAGGVWASGLEAVRRAFYVDRQSESESIMAGLKELQVAWGDFDPGDHAKSLPRLLDALVFYFTRYPLATDPVQPAVGPNGPMIEFNFVLPIADDLLHPTTGEPLLYSGRSDMVATYCGALSIFDDKTTSSLGASWSQQWDLRAQFSGYCWAAREFGMPATQVVARGISILKTKYDTAQAITHRPDWRIDRWHTQLVRDIKRAQLMWTEGIFDMAEDDACNSYGGCMFTQPCQSADPQPWLETGFVRMKWDPITRTRNPVEA